MFEDLPQVVSVLMGTSESKENFSEDGPCGATGLKEKLMR